MKRREWSYGYKGIQETHSVTLTAANCSHFGVKDRRTIEFGYPKVKTLDDMTDGEVRALELQYGCRVIGRRFDWGLL